MKFSILTIFPDSIDSYINSSIISKARSRNLIDIEIINFRKEKHMRVDDYAYGGKSGMVLKVDPIVSSLREHNLTDKHIILLSASGKTFNQELAKNLRKYEHIVLICGHYEGVDARISNYISQEISIGDYVITSGELAALVVLDSISRLVPEVINNQSLESESFEDNLLDFPVYTRPQEFEGYKIPEVYLTGNHKEIDKYRLSERERITKERRPDLFAKYLKLKRSRSSS